MINFLIPPIFDDEDKTLAARHLFIIIWTFIAIGWMPLVMAAIIPETGGRWLLVVGVIEVSGIILLILNKYGYTRTAKYLLIFIIWAAATGMTLTGGGVSSNAMSIYLITVLIAGLLQSGKAGFIAAAFCSLTGLFLVYLEYSGSLPENQVSHTPLTEWIANTIYMIIIISLQYLVSQTIREALKQSRQELTERKQAEQKLKKSEEHYRLLADHMKDQVWLMDMKLKPIYISPSVEKSRGYTFEEIAQLPLDKHLTAKSLKSAMDFFSNEMPKALADPTYYMTSLLELEFNNKDGSTLWVENTFSLIRDENGKPISLLGVGRDITERKLVEDELQKSEENYRLLFETAGEGILIAQGDMIKFANPALSEILGYPSDIITTRPFSSFIHPDDRAMVFDRHVRRLRGELMETGYRFRIIAADGTQRWLHIVSRILSWEGMPASLSFVIDITDHKKAEEALQQSEEKYRLIFEHSPLGLLSFDEKGVIVACNNNFVKIIGSSREALIGLNMLNLPDKNIVSAVHQALNGNTGLYEDVYSSVTAKKSTPVRALFTPMFSEDKHILGGMGIIEDITARKQAEEEKKILQERLQQADKMEAIGTLAGGIAHDFNNLLMGIQGYASMTLMNIDPSNPNYERLKRIEEQVQSGADLTSQLLGFARGGRYEVKPTDINEIIEKTSSMFGRTKKEIAINRKTAKDLWNVEVDRGQMEQVFLNLYVNAWQAMPGGGDIYLETQNVLLNDEKVLPFSGKPGKHVKITITDTGTGMDEKTKERIFDPFFTTKAMGRGTGLGLATVYGIIKGHHGMINVYSEPGHGTTFTIYLPASDKEIPKEKAPIGEIITGTETILLVDDEKMVLEVNRELLESMGYKVYGAGSGQEGIAIYAENKDKIDLVILDMIMPGISGSETFDRLREINPDIKVLLSSGYSLNGEAQTIMDRGCNGFLQKPFRLEELSGKVREMLM